MEENIDNIEDKKEVMGSGAMLAQARKALSKSVEEIATELNLSVSQIKTIELDQSQGLPEPTYVRGYIRSYANLVGLNPEEVLSNYLNKNWQKSTNLDDLPRGIADSEHGDTNLFSPARVIAFLILASALGFLAYTGILSSLFDKSSVQDTADAARTSSAEVANIANTNNVSEFNEPVVSNTGLTGAVETAEEEVQRDSNTAFDLNTGEPSPTSELSLNAADSVSQEAQSNAHQSELGQTDVGQTRVILTFTDTSWVDIRDEDQNRLAYQSYPAGETLEVSAEGILSVLLGNAKGVTMTLNGSDYDLTQHTEGVYAKFSVGVPKQ